MFIAVQIHKLYNFCQYVLIMTKTRLRCAWKNFLRVLQYLTSFSSVANSLASFFSCKISKILVSLVYNSVTTSPNLHTISTFTFSQLVMYIVVLLYRLRVAGLHGLQGLIHKTSNDLQCNIWKPTHMDKIMPSLLENLRHDSRCLMSSCHVNSSYIFYSSTTCIMFLSCLCLYMHREHCQHNILNSIRQFLTKLTSLMLSCDVRWWLSVVVSTLALFNEVNRHWARPVSTWMGDCLRTGKPSGYMASYLGRLSLLRSVRW